MLHYLDDFFTAGPANSNDYMNNLTAMLSLCNKINAPVKSSKVEGPSTALTFLGILLDTTTMKVSITQDQKQASAYWEIFEVGNFRGAKFLRFGHLEANKFSRMAI